MTQLEKAIANIERIVASILNMLDKHRMPKQANTIAESWRLVREAAERGGERG